MGYCKQKKLAQIALIYVYRSAKSGLTPPAGLMKQAVNVDIPAYVMVRPKASNFKYSVDDLDIMLHDVSVVREYGLAEVVFGAEGDDKALDVYVVSTLMTASFGLDTTLHHVIDCVADIQLALELAIDLGFYRICTSGDTIEAETGKAMIAKMVKQAVDRTIVMPRSGLMPANIRKIGKATGAMEFHTSCCAPAKTGTKHLFSNHLSFATRSEMVRDRKNTLA